MIAVGISRTVAGGGVSSDVVSVADHAEIVGRSSTAMPRISLTTASGSGYAKSRTRSIVHSSDGNRSLATAEIFARKRSTADAVNDGATTRRNRVVGWYPGAGTYETTPAPLSSVPVASAASRTADRSTHQRHLHRAKGRSLPLVCRSRLPLDGRVERIRIRQTIRLTQAREHIYRRCPFAPRHERIMPCTLRDSKHRSVECL